MITIQEPNHGWSVRRLRHGPSGCGTKRAKPPARQPRPTDRGFKIFMASAEQSRLHRLAVQPRAPFDDLARARIVAAAVARISPDDTAAALGWTVGEVHAAEQRLGLRVTVTIEAAP